MATKEIQCKVFEGECQCKNKATTNPTEMNLCDEHNIRFIYLKDLYYNNFDEYEKIEVEKKLYFNKYTLFQILNSPNANINGNTMLTIRPEFIYEWDFTKNINILYYGESVNIHDILVKSSKKFWWNCRCENIIEKSPVERIRAKFSCKDCAFKELSIHDSKRTLRKEREKIDKENGKISNIEKADIIEEYFIKLLNSTCEFLNVEKIGQLGGKSDILVTLKDNTIRQIQVKTLSKKHKYSYKAQLMQKYEKNMLLVGTNVQYDRFFIGFCREFENDTMTFPFVDGKKYNEFCYSKDNSNKNKDENAFLKKLIELIPFSTSENYLSDTHRKEYESQKRFETYCNTFNASFERNSTNGNAIDGFIVIRKDGVEYRYPTQNKFISVPDKKYENVFNVCSDKSCGIGVHQPYHVDDGIEYFIIEIGGPINDITKYHNQFMIIPKEEMVLQKIFQSEKCKGKQAFSVRPPDFQKTYWTNKFWNTIPKELST